MKKAKIAGVKERTIFIVPHQTRAKGESARRPGT
jgi:hypothetical protein